MILIYLGKAMLKKIEDDIEKNHKKRVYVSFLCILYKDLDDNIYSIYRA